MNAILKYTLITVGAVVVVLSLLDDDEPSNTTVSRSTVQAAYDNSSSSGRSSSSSYGSRESYGVSFNSTRDVIDFLNNKTFGNSVANIFFTNQGGVVDGYTFSYTDISVIGSNRADVRIFVPQIQLSGHFILTVSGSSASLYDCDSQTTYPLK